MVWKRLQTSLLVAFEALNHITVLTWCGLLQIALNGCELLQFLTDVLYVAIAEQLAECTLLELCFGFN